MKHRRKSNVLDSDTQLFIACLGPRLVMLGQTVDIDFDLDEISFATPRGVFLVYFCA